MSESLEDRALRIYEDNLLRWYSSGNEHIEEFNAAVVEFARRLMAEQGEPVGYTDSSWFALLAAGNSFQETLISNIPDRGRNIPLYASPPSDALDAKRYRWLRNEASSSTAIVNKLPAVFDEHDFPLYESALDAAIDAAMEKSHE